MRKTIGQIKEGVARGHGYPNWINFINDQPNYNVELIMNEVAICYAQQFQPPTDVINTEIMSLRERVSELELCLIKSTLVLSDIDNTLFHHNHSVTGWHLNGDEEPIMNFVAHYEMEVINEAESLINKSK